MERVNALYTVAKRPNSAWKRTFYGLFGNNTDLSGTVFVQRGQSLTIAGKWFRPGNGTLLWDNITNVGATAIAPSGEFQTTVTMPYTTAGEHTLVINDGNTIHTQPPPQAQA